MDYNASKKFRGFLPLNFPLQKLGLSPSSLHHFSSPQDLPQDDCLKSYPLLETDQNLLGLISFQKNKCLISLTDIFEKFTFGVAQFIFLVFQWSNFSILYLIGEIQMRNKNGPRLETNVLQLTADTNSKIAKNGNAHLLTFNKK